MWRKLSSLEIVLNPRQCGLYWWTCTALVQDYRIKACVILLSSWFCSSQVASPSSYLMLTPLCQIYGLACFRNCQMTKRARHVFPVERTTWEPNELLSKLWCFLAPSIGSPSVQSPLNWGNIIRGSARPWCQSVGKRLGKQAGFEMYSMHCCIYTVAPRRQLRMLRMPEAAAPEIKLPGVRQ